MLHQNQKLANVAAVAIFASLSSFKQKTNSAKNDKKNKTRNVSKNFKAIMDMYKLC